MNVAAVKRLQLIFYDENLVPLTVALIRQMRFGTVKVHKGLIKYAIFYRALIEGGGGS
jgi:hypothetical protein